MTFKEWWVWFKALHFTKKWYLVLIIIRPIVDNFYELKEISALASPLYIVGVLTPVFIFISFTSKKFPKKIPSGNDMPWAVFSAFLVFNCFIFYAIDLSVVAFGDLIKYTTPVLLYYYSRRFVQNAQDLHGILIAFLVSSIFPFGMMIYEAFNPIAIQYIGAGRGGGSRIRGGYGDIMNYAVYIVGLFLVSGYFFLKNVYGKYRLVIKPWHMLLIFGFVIYGLTQIKHVSTWTVSLTLLLLLLLHNLRNLKGIFFVIILLGCIIPFFAEDLYNAQIEPLINKELKVADGETDDSHAFNGRMSRWERYFEVWEQMPAFNHFFGVASSNFDETIIMIGAGMHSDYVRLLFLTGFIGLAFYIIFLFAIGMHYFRLFMPEKFLLIGALASLILWSVSTIPLLYAPFLYITFPIFSYALLPANRQKG
ncbi:MAG: hypothetical protein ABI772_05455 [Bacteroidota bacterium]